MSVRSQYVFSPRSLAEPSCLEKGARWKGFISGLFIQMKNFHTNHVARVSQEFAAVSQYLVDIWTFIVFSLYNSRIVELFHHTHAYTKDLPLTAFKVNDPEYPPHWHSEVELLYVLAGSVGISVNQRRQTVGPGSLVILESRAVHAFERESRRAVAIIIVFKPEIIGNRDAWPLFGHSSENVIARIDHQAFSRRAEALAVSLLAEMKEKRPGFGSLAIGYVQQLCGLIERETIGRPDEAAAAGEVQPEASKPQAPEVRPVNGALARMQPAIDYIHEKANYEVMLKDAAKVVSLSPCYFSRIFKKAVGMGFSPFVNEVRIERAERLMANTTKTLADIALECGFDNLRTFNRAFRAIRGKTPSAEREAVRSRAAGK
jgi:AraC-like DNA-binding protein/mannose-6-phosphate isomerase-like protein (cupin superfamily)